MKRKQDTDAEQTETLMLCFSGVVGCGDLFFLVL